MAYKILSDAERAEINRRLDAGDAIPRLAKEFGVSYNTIKNQKASATSPKVIKTATAIVESRKAQDTVAIMLSTLTPTQQEAAITLADAIPLILPNSVNAAVLNAKTSHRMAYIANLQASKLDEENPDLETAKLVHGLLDTANKAAYQPLELIKANKGGPVVSDETPLATLDVTRLSSAARRELLEARGDTH